MLINIQDILDALAKNRVDFRVLSGRPLVFFDAVPITGASSFLEADSGRITFLSKNWKGAKTRLTKGSIVLTDDELFVPDENQIAIFLESPKFHFARICNSFFTYSHLEELHPAREVISHLMKVGRVGDNCRIAENSQLNLNVNIGSNVVISSGAVIYGNSHVGDNSVLGPGAIIGKSGFGYEKSKNEVTAIPHYGGVRIGCNVEIGANTCIDRGQFGETEIQDHVKIDNLVHIAHNCRIQSRSFVIAGAVICGSVQVESDVWIGASACIRESLIVGTSSVVGLGAVVVKNVAPGEVVVGNPARPLVPQ